MVGWMDGCTEQQGLKDVWRDGWWQVVVKQALVSCFSVQNMMVTETYSCSFCLQLALEGCFEMESCGFLVFLSLSCCSLSGKPEIYRLFKPNNSLWSRRGMPSSFLNIIRSMILLSTVTCATRLYSPFLILCCVGRLEIAKKRDVLPNNLSLFFSCLLLQLRQPLLYPLASLEPMRLAWIQVHSFRQHLSRAL